MTVEGMISDLRKLSMRGPWPRNSVPGFEPRMLFLECRSKSSVNSYRLFTYEMHNPTGQTEAKAAKCTRLGYTWAIFLGPSSHRFRSLIDLQRRAVARRVRSQPE